MKTNLRGQDEKIAKDFLDRELDEGRVFQDAGRAYWAVERFESVAFLAEGFLEIPGLASRIDGLKAEKAYSRFLLEEKRRDRREAEFLAGFGPAFGALEGREGYEGENEGRKEVPSILRDMRVSNLLKEAKTASTMEDRSLASRLLFSLVFAAQTRAIELFSKSELPLAAAYLDLAIGACEPALPREKDLYLNRAVVALRLGERRKALDFLEAAVEKGFSDAGLLETSDEFEAVRDNPRFQEIVDKARSPAKRRA